MSHSTMLPTKEVLKRAWFTGPAARSASPLLIPLIIGTTFSISVLTKHMLRDPALDVSKGSKVLDDYLEAKNTDTAIITATTAHKYMSLAEHGPDHGAAYWRASTVRLPPVDL